MWCHNDSAHSTFTFAHFERLSGTSYHQLKAIAWVNKKKNTWYLLNIVQQLFRIIFRWTECPEGKISLCETIRIFNRWNTKNINGSIPVIKFSAPNVCCHIILLSSKIWYIVWTTSLIKWALVIKHTGHQNWNSHITRQFGYKHIFC